VILQQVVGTEHHGRYYPDFSGVTRSWNFYPMPPATSADGVATVALGLGRAVVDGGKALSFCPRTPKQLIQFTSVDDILTNAQSEFWALELDGVHEGEARMREARFGLDVAEQDGTLHLVGSTYSADNNAVYDGLSRKGVRIVSFAPVLKHNLFPLPAVLQDLQRLGEESLGRPVEIEFAARMARNHEGPSDFGFLQMRPLVLSRESEDISLDDVMPEQVLCRSSKVLGNGRYNDLLDVIVVDYHRFERGRSQHVAEAISRVNSKLVENGTPYLLIGVGRWGSNDPWLGIPVSWEAVSGARVIVEAGFRDFRVTPSQGSHFFQNLTAFQVAYFTVNPDLGEGSVDWEWLAQQEAVEEHDCVRHLRFRRPAVVLISGRAGIGVIVKPYVDHADFLYDENGLPK
jgi:hypothetical protein